VASGGGDSFRFGEVELGKTLKLPIATRGNESESLLQFFQCGLSNNNTCYITVDEY
jgi:hypothetical protein